MGRVTRPGGDGIRTPNPDVPARHQDPWQRTPPPADKPRRPHPADGRALLRAPAAHHRRSHPGAESGKHLRSLGPAAADPSMVRSAPVCNFPTARLRRFGPVGLHLNSLTAAKSHPRQSDNAIYALGVMKSADRPSVLGPEQRPQAPPGKAGPKRPPPRGPADPGPGPSGTGRGAHRTAGGRRGGPSQPDDTRGHDPVRSLPYTLQMKKRGGVPSRVKAAVRYI